MVSAFGFPLYPCNLYIATQIYCANLSFREISMIDEPLKRLLDAEAKAELIIADADTARQSVIEQARQDVREEERQFAERASGIRASFLEQSEQQAQQTIAELKRRHSELSAKLQAVAEQRKKEALDAAVALLTGSGKARP